MNRARLSLVLLAVGVTAGTAPAQYSYPGYPMYGPQPPMNGAFPAYGMPIEPVGVPPNTMVTSGAFVATPPPAANGFSTPPPAQDPLIEPPYISRIWGGLDYTIWWVKAAPRPVPIVTTGSDADLVPGAVGQMGTMVLEGNNHADFGDLSGGRASAGMWLNCDRCVGIEGSAFATENAIKRFAVRSDSSRQPGPYSSRSSTMPSRPSRRTSARRSGGRQHRRSHGDQHLRASRSRAQRRPESVSNRVRRGGPARGGPVSPADRVAERRHRIDGHGGRHDNLDL